MHRNQIAGQLWVAEREPGRWTKVQNRLRWLNKRVAFHEQAVALIEAAALLAATAEHAVGEHHGGG